MPDQILPVTGLHEIGVIKDTPPVSLPPNAFTDARNVRFRDGAVIKMEGDHTVFDNNVDAVRYVVWWPNPNRADNDTGYFILIRRETVDGNEVERAYLYQPSDGTIPAFKGTATVPTVIGTFTAGGNWQHTLFHGGFAIILNNGLDVPHYILDADGNDDIQMVPNMAELQGWESYGTNEVILNDEFMSDVHSPVFDLGQLVDYSVNDIYISLSEPNGGANYAETKVETNGTVMVATNAATPSEYCAKLRIILMWPLYHVLFLVMSLSIMIVRACSLVPQGLPHAHLVCPLIYLIIL